MKLITFRAAGEVRVGVFLDEHRLAVDLSRGRSLLDRPDTPPPSVRGILEAGETALDAARQIAEAARKVEEGVPGALGEIAFPEPEIEWLPPVPDPTKIIAVGLNYRDHCEEQGLAPPDAVTVFCKFPSSLTGHEPPIVYPSETTKLDYEAELAVVIGKTAKDVTPHRALDHVAGYMNMNDVTARDIQKAESQWVRSKSFDTFAPCGPFLVTADEVGDAQALDISCAVNGETRQRSNTKQMICGVAELVSRFSRSFTLLPGDIITTGTPGGVGVYADPPRLLQSGDVVEVEVRGLGVLRNRVVAAE